ncbi:MAG: hypothetical protein PHC61_09370, partial [Chitinivibrionales bacterium]|nr:hypothetical protein [Chitinivibrionales bacterium]
TRIDGKPFFAHGFFVEADTPAMANQVRTIGEAGFNLAFVLQRWFNGACDAAFTEAQNHGVNLIYAPSLNPSMGVPYHTIIDGVKNKPALFGYAICDDMHDAMQAGGYPSTVDDVKALYDDFTIYDPNHLTFVALGAGSWDNLCFSQKRFNVPAAEIYPVNGGSPINLVYSTTVQEVSLAAQWRQSPWVCVQTFNWATNANQRMPTPAEYYNMLYQSITAGAKGIIYYTFKTGSTTLASTDTNLWNETKKAALEITRISSFLTSGKMTATILGTGLYAATWTYNDSALAIVVNAGNYCSYLDTSLNAADTRTVSISLPAGVVGPANSLFPGRPSGMTYSNGKLTGSINLLGVHIYVLRMPPTTRVLPEVSNVDFFKCNTTARAINYALSKPCFVSINFYDLQGRTVCSYVNNYQQPGYYTLKLPATLSRKMYIQEFRAGDFVKKERFVVSE